MNEEKYYKYIIREKFLRLWTGRVLIITFIVLKLTNVIDWSWWWILVPILIFEF